MAATLQDGDLLPPYEQCLSTPFQCIASRVGLAATTWAIFADLNVNPFEVTLAPTKVGIFRSGLWMLDVNGNGVFDAGVDKSFNWGYPGTTRVQGDWNGDGKQKAGLYIGLCAGICGEGRIAGFGLG